MPRSRAGALELWLALLPFTLEFGVRFPVSAVWKKQKMFLPHPHPRVGGLRDREVACSASDRQGSNFESCVWRTVSSHSSHHPQEVLLAKLSLYVHKGGLKPDSFHLPRSNVKELNNCLISFVFNFFPISYIIINHDCQMLSLNFNFTYTTRIISV